MPFEDLPAPEAGKVFACKVGTTHLVFTVPSAWKGRKVDVAVRGAAATAAVWLVFGTSTSVEADRTAFVTGTPPGWTVNPKTGRPCRDGEIRDYHIKPSWSHFSVEAADADTEIYITPSDFSTREG